MIRALYLACAVVFLTILVVSINALRRSRTRRVSDVLKGIAAMSGVFVIVGAQESLGPNGTTEGAGQLLLGAYALLATVVVGTVGVGGLRRLDRAEQVAATQLPRPPGQPQPVQVRLTPREVSVVHAIHSGVLTDAELAEALFVSPATAGTHVRNILRKTRLRSRRELILLEIPSAEES